MDTETPRRFRRLRRWVIIAGALLVVAVLASLAAGLYTDSLWFGEIGFSSVFRRTVAVRFALGAIFGVAFGVVAGVNVWVARRLAARHVAARGEEQASPLRLSRFGTTVTLGVVGVAALIAGVGASGQWDTWLLSRHVVPFGSTDPVFGRDVSFYVFSLPWMRFLFTWLWSALVFSLVLSVGYYYIFGCVDLTLTRARRLRDRVAPVALAHLSVLVGIMLLLKAWGYRLGEFGLLYSNRGPVNGASYADRTAQLPALRAMVVIALIAAVVVIANVKRRGWLLPWIGIAVLGAGGLASSIYPAAVQRLTVSPNERVRERETIQNNLDATRAAYGLEDVDVRTFPGTAPLTAAEARADQPTIENIRLWDPNVLVGQFLNLQRIKQYYEFLNVDTDRYDVGDRRREVMMSAREVDVRGLPNGSRTWVNKHLVYTHGYGVVASRVDRVLGDGAPDLIVKDIPPRADAGIDITQPQIYYGETSQPNFVVTGTSLKELDYPQGARFAQNTYDGSGGIAMGGIVRRAAFAWRFGDLNLLISSAITKDSKILFGRNILNRAQRALPFLTFDGDPYIAVVDGRLVWILDGYTTTSMYPNAQRSNLGSVTNDGIRGTANYIREAVKVVVDAKDGTVTGFVWDEQDPILRAWMQAFPGILQPRASMPPSILAHVRYPESLFAIQTDKFSSYHITDPDDFYLREDVWAIAQDPRPGKGKAAPEYVLQTLPGEDALRFMLVRSFTPVGRPNLAAYMVAHSDADVYGGLVAYEFPTSEAILGPELAQARINQDPAVSQQVTLWSQQQSKVIRGNLFIVPIGESLLYVQPLYLQGQGSKLPELKRVVALTGQSIEMADTLTDALNAIFGDTAHQAGGSIGDLVRRAKDAFEKANDALARGDYAEFGRQMKRAQRALEQADAAAN